MRVQHVIHAARACVAALAVSAIAANPASATLYAWTLSGGGDSGAGFLTTGAPDNGGFDITAISGEIDGAAIAGLLGGQPGAEALSPSGAFLYDNILYPSADSAEGALLDTGGILVAIASGEGNIWGNFGGPGGYSYYTYASVAGTYLIQNNDTNFTAVDPPSPAPEPASASLVALGLAGLWMMRRRSAT